MDFLFSGEAWAALITLTVLEIVLGVDNIVFIAILAGKLPPHQQARAEPGDLALLADERGLALPPRSRGGLDLNPGGR